MTTAAEVQNSLETDKKTIPLEELYKNQLSANLKIRHKNKELENQLFQNVRYIGDLHDRIDELKREIQYLKNTITSILEIQKVEIQ